MAIFLRAGYDRASVDAIAGEAGVSKQTIYNHFDGKERLFLAAVEVERDRVATRFAAPVTDGARRGGSRGAHRGRAAVWVARWRGAAGARGGPARAALTAYGRQVRAVLLDERASALRRLIIAEAGRYPSLRPACAHGEPESLVSAGADLLRRRTEAGELAVPDPSGAAR